MSTLSLALYCEGPTDKYFLPIIIQRASQDILGQCGKNIVEVLPIEVIDAPKQKQGKGILEVALKSVGRHVLIIHADADSRTYEQAKAQSFIPGYNLVQKTHQKVCKNLVAMIPVREVEAWMIADVEALQVVLETKATASDLGLPTRAKLVEADSDPKATLKQVVTKAYASRSRRHRSIGNWHAFYETLAQEIKLERLKAVPAFQRFDEDLTTSFKVLNLIQ